MRAMRVVISDPPIGTQDMMTFSRHDDVYPENLVLLEFAESSVKKTEIVAFRSQCLSCQLYLRAEEPQLYAG